MGERKVLFIFGTRPEAIKMAPFPEEINRECIGRMADLHFAPTRLAADRLRAENRSTNVFVTGNTGIDAMKSTRAYAMPLTGF